MAHEQHRSALPSRNFIHFSNALLLKLGIADSQYLVDYQNLRLKVSRDCECQPNIHSRGIMLYRRIEEFFELGKGDDFIQFSPNFPLRHAEDGAVKENVLPSTELRVETCANLEQACNATT